MTASAKKWIIVVAAVGLLLLLSSELAKAANVVAPNLGVGTQRKSFLGQADLPRGIRNNNPGNLKMTTPQQGWLGSIDRGENTDGVFEQFVFYGYGLRAMLKLMRNKMTRNGDNSIRKLIYSWAPPGENSTENYIAAVENVTGIPQNQVIDVNDKDRLFAIAQAIESQENGKVVMTRRDFDNAYALI